MGLTFAHAGQAEEPCSFWEVKMLPGTVLQRGGSTARCKDSRFLTCESPANLCLFRGDSSREQCCVSYALACSGDGACLMVLPRENACHVADQESLLWLRVCRALLHCEQQLSLPYRHHTVPETHGLFGRRMRSTREECLRNIRGRLLSHEWSRKPQRG